MAFVQFSKISLAFGDRDILKNVSLNLRAGSRAALAGVNGSGKSTLLRVIAGNMAADSGERAVQKGSRLSWLPQSGIVHRGRTLREEAEAAYDSIAALVNAMDGIGQELEKSETDDRKTALLLAEYQRLQDAVENSGYYRREETISMVLSGLGFSENDRNRRAEEFSGGWQMRIALAKALLESPDILLLDEPTNYLDIEARGWLEDWLRAFSGGYILVSHDRYFLDVTVNEVYEIFQGSLKRYAGNYSAYEAARETENESLRKRYAEQQEEIAKSEDLIRRFRYKASKAAMVQERIKKLEKMERVELPESLKKINITFPPPPRSGRTALSLRGIGKAYGTRRVIEGLDLDLDAGERLVVVGRNGAGKTTLLRILAGEDPGFEGELRYGAGIAPGYFSQDAAEALTGITGDETGTALSVLEFMEREAPTALVPRVRDMLGAFLFRGDDVYKSVSVLSGGEKSRLALLKMLLRPVNLLILDEPTNHLDIYSKDILLDTLKKFSGTVIFVSHDRAFMEALSSKTLELRANPRDAEGRPVSGFARHRLFYGDYGYYLDRIAREGMEAPPPARVEPAAVPDAGEKPAAEAAPARQLPKTILVKAGSPSLAGGPGISASEQREAAKRRQTAIRRLAKEEQEILAALEKLEAEKTALETELARPEVYTSAEKARSAKMRLDRIHAEVEAKSQEWEAKAGELARAASGPGSREDPAQRELGEGL
ncbi:MAG: ABC-F family ATP-binding cassette domain-containing protein [Spirochaetaceae bacterium]|jgi:ATP-binding cassette subfamily F protein 3|nr:ABC-F family ATP-binding cassette domain-containing protein [Spirochaetaceae bacterium]